MENLVWPILGIIFLVLTKLNLDRNRGLDDKHINQKSDALLFLIPIVFFVYELVINLSIGLVLSIPIGLLMISSFYYFLFFKKK